MVKMIIVVKMMIVVNMIMVGKMIMMVKVIRVVKIMMVVKMMMIKDDKKKELKNKEELRDRKNKYFGGTLNVRGVDKEDLQLNVAERLEVKRMNVRLLVGKRLRVNFERWKVGK